MVQASRSSRIVIIGQAPGRLVHESGIAWNDPSGRRLREWLDMSPEQFYDPSQIALIPMGFCFPGTGKSGDLPPRTECAPLWHQKVMDQFQDLRLSLVIGAYAQGCYLKGKGSVTETVKKWRDHLPEHFPLPHPSPRNNLWLRKNPWFESEVLPALKEQVRRALGG